MATAGNAASDPLPEAVALVQGAAQAGHTLKILGGLGVRVLCPDFPPRLRPGQDIDLACLGKTRRRVADHLERAGCGSAGTPPARPSTPTGSAPCSPPTGAGGGP